MGDIRSLCRDYFYECVFILMSLKERKVVGYDNAFMVCMVAIKLNSILVAQVYNLMAGFTVFKMPQ